MSKLILVSLLVVLFTTSCSSTADARAEWYVKDVSAEKRLWRYCSDDKDGAGKTGTGICYISQKCIKKFLRKEKCENVYMTCAYGAGYAECLNKNKWPAVAKGN